MMLTNDQMKANRFARWHGYRKMIANIQATLAADGEILIPSYLRSVRYDKRHVGMFKANKSGDADQRAQTDRRMHL